MISFFISMFIFFTAVMLYRRYYPVRGSAFIENQDIKSDIIVIDMRDYRDAEKGAYVNYLNIPYAYLKRNYQEIPADMIHVIATDQLELNLGLRYLKAKGMKVSSYSLKGHQPNKKYKGDTYCEV